MKKGLSICYKCNQMLPVGMFYKRATGLIMTECKACFKLRSCSYNTMAESDPDRYQAYQVWYRENYKYKRKRIKDEQKR